MLVGTGPELEFSATGVSAADAEDHFLVCRLMTVPNDHPVADGEYYAVVQFVATSTTSIAANVGNFFGGPLESRTMGCYVLRATSESGRKNLKRLAMNTAADVGEHLDADIALPWGTDVVSQIHLVPHDGNLVTDSGERVSDPVRMHHLRGPRDESWLPKAAPTPDTFGGGAIPEG